MRLSEIVKDMLRNRGITRFLSFMNEDGIYYLTDGYDKYGLGSDIVKGNQVKGTGPIDFDKDGFQIVQIGELAKFTEEPVGYYNAAIVKLLIKDKVASVYNGLLVNTREFKTDNGF